MKIFAHLIPTNLGINSLISFFCHFLETKNKNQLLSKLVVWKRDIFLHFVYSESRCTSKPYGTNSIDFSKGLFLYVIPVRIIVSWFVCATFKFFVCKLFARGFLLIFKTSSWLISTVMAA